MIINIECNWISAKYVEPAERQLRRSSIQAQSAPLPKLPSTESLSTSVNITAGAPPVSPGINLEIFSKIIHYIAIVWDNSYQLQVASQTWLALYTFIFAT